MATVFAPNFIPEELKQIWLDAYIANGGLSGGENAILGATNAMRGDLPGTQQNRAIYDKYFGGNRRQDGTYRYSEEQYQAVTYGFDEALLGYGINPEPFKGRYAELIGGNVDIDEFGNRISTGYALVIDQAPEIAAWYQQNYGLAGLEPEDIVAAFLDPSIGEEILKRNVRVSLIGGAGRQAGFDVARTMAESILDYGLGQPEAREVFASAASQLPILNTLAKRHSDPDDDFDLYEFTAATVFNDPAERRRLGRLVAQEQALFSGGSTITSVGRSLTGLRSR